MIEKKKKQRNRPKTFPARQLLRNEKIISANGNATKQLEGKTLKSQSVNHRRKEKEKK